MKKLLLAVIGLLFSQVALAQSSTDDIDFVARLMVDLFRKHNLQVLCLPGPSTLQSIRPSIDEKLNGINPDVKTQENANAIATVIFTTFPCPFSPLRPELRLATAKDLAGNWIVPETSQRLRYGPQSPQWKNLPGMPPLRCEGVSYSPDGDTRVAEFRGALPCPTSKDMDALKTMPKVQTWSFLRDGRLQTTHRDAPGEREEWDVFFVEKPFEFSNVRFSQGDLVAYLRYQKNNNLNVATVFRHLQRLP